MRWLLLFGMRLPQSRWVLIVILSLYNSSRALPNVDPAIEPSSRAIISDSKDPESECDGLRVPRTASKATQNDFKTWQAEWAFGRKLAVDMEQNVEMVTEEFTVTYVNRLEQKLVSSSNLRGCFVVKVLHDPEPNAYSLPGGFIYITTGLIQLAGSEAQLVAALAHETAHVSARHLTRLDAQMHVWGHAALFAGPVGYAMRRYLGPVLILKLVRNKEFEADRLGLQFDIASGYDPNEFCRLLEVVFPDGTNESVVDRLHESHPSTSSRIERLRSAIRRARISNECIVDSSSFAEMKLHLAAFITNLEKG